MKGRFIGSIFLVLFFFISTFVYGAIPAQERAALIALYNSTNGDNWTDNSGWKTPPLHTDGFALPGTEENWHGIHINDSYVCGVDFVNNNLTGTIPPEIENLRNLTALTLDGGYLSGSIPPEIGNLSKLSFLILQGNQLSGSLPPELGNLSNLEIFWMRTNQLSGTIPSQLGNLKKLVQLILQSNQLTGSIPAALGNLSFLEWLSMDDNQLSGNIPEELGNLSNLEYLYLYDNQLSGSIPTEFGNLKKLRHLGMAQNQLTGNIPSQIGNLSELDLLYLSSNKLSGEIPSTLTNLTKIKLFGIAYNCLFATDPTLRIWLNTNDPDWEDNQNQCGGTNPTITVVSPNGGETWAVGSSRAITWTTTGTVGNVKIEYSINSGSNWSTITASPGNSGTYTWTVPDAVSSQCRVKISEAADGNPSDSSDADFSITSGSSPTINITRKKMRFTATPSGKVTMPQNAWIKNTGVGTLNWSANVDTSWLSCDPLSGIDDGIIYVSADPTGLTVGTYTGTVSVSDPNADNSPQTIAVTLEVISNNQDKKPFGEFSTPMDGSTVSSSIPVTGWVLDDVGVESVKIYREEGKKSLVYIGDGVFVEGARPDVETVYPDYPNNYKAGWGYMLLTNFLPNNGSGKFTLHAIATDVEGETVTLGTKTITVDNVNAIKPFGTLDTPTQGGTASGSDFINWGWALTPQPNNIPVDGSTIKVWVDGIEVGHPTYNRYREDIAVLFPDYANSNGAVAYFSLDTTAYENGVHTIQWTVKDSAGNSDGIGSRYFSILNTGNDLSPTMRTTGRIDTNVVPRDLTHIPVNRWDPVKIRKGYKDIEPQSIAPEAKGSIIIDIMELERLEIYFFDPGTEPGSPATSNRTIQAISALPIGSTLDTDAGVLYWQPGAGFIGQYPMVFIEKVGTEPIHQKKIIINIHLKFPVTVEH